MDSKSSFSRRTQRGIKARCPCYLIVYFYPRQIGLKVFVIPCNFAVIFSTKKDLLGAEMVLIVCFWDAICIRAYKTLSVPHWKHSSQFKLFQIMTIISDKNECSFIIKLKQSQLLVRKSFKVFSQLSSFLTFLDNLRV